MLVGGDSSIQYNSSWTFLANLARERATVLASCLTQLIAFRCSPWIRQSTSPYTPPSKEWQKEEIERITLTLSPSMIKSMNPASIENSRAFLHARTSASSMYATGGPLIDIAAITSSFSFRIIAPKPEHFSLAKTTASKFNLKIDVGGCCHTITLACVAGIASWS